MEKLKIAVIGVSRLGTVHAENIALRIPNRITSYNVCYTKLLRMFTLKPLDEACVLDVINSIGKIITVEDHNWLNGLGSAVSDIVAREGKGIRNNFV